MADSRQLTPMLYFQLLLALATFAAVALLIYGVFSYPAAMAAPAHRRVAAALGRDRETVFDKPALRPVLAIAMQVAQRVGLASLRAKLRRDLSASGNPSGYSVDEYLALCLLSGVGLGVVTAAIDLALGGSTLPLTLPVMTALGLAIPVLVLRGSARSRTRRIAKQLPYSLDLIALMVEAGASFNESIETLIRDDPEDELNAELRVVLSEIDLGTPRAQALANLAERVPLESLRSVVAAVSQADKLGTPLAAILKLQAEMMRQQRSVRAEKLSASASLRILIPSMLILLAVVAIVFAPFIIRAIRGELF